MHNILFLLIFLTGCTEIYKPPNNSPFCEIYNLSELDGTYLNHGKPKHYLSELLMPHNILESNNLKSNEIKHVQIQSNAKELNILLIKDNCISLVHTYILDKDFALENGQITLSSDFKTSSSVHFGPIYESKTVGLDTEGNGKYQSKGYGAGLIYLLFPFAIYGSGEVKFEKLTTNPIYYKCNTANKVFQPTAESGG